MHGMIKKMPGPLAPPFRRRPNRNMTDLSYSWTTCNDSLVGGPGWCWCAQQAIKADNFRREIWQWPGSLFQMGIFGYCFLIASNFPFKAKDQRHLASTRKTNEVRLRFLSITMDRLHTGQRRPARLARRVRTATQKRQFNQLRSTRKRARGNGFA